MKIFPFQFILYILVSGFLFGCSDAVWDQTLSGNNNLDHQKVIIQENIVEDVNWKYIKISGPWEFYWMRLLEPKDFQNSNSEINPDLILNEFKPWTKYLIAGEKLPKQGYATYRTKVKLPERDSKLAIYYPHLFTTSKIWVNGLLMAEKGNVSSKLNEVVASRTNTYFAFESQDNHLEIILQIANSDFYQGGPRGAFYLGTQKGILDYYLSKVVLDVLAFGLILGATVYHVFFYYLNQSQKPFLYFSIVSFTLLLRLPFHNTKLYEIFFSEVIWLHQSLFLHVVNIFSIISAFYFFNSLFPNKTNRWVFVFYWVGGIFALFIGMIDFRILSLANLYYVSIYLPAFVLHAIYLTFFNVDDRRPSYLIGLGIIGLGIFGLIAIVTNYLGVDGGFFLLAGFLFFVLLQALALSRFFTIALENRSKLQLQMTKENLKALTKQREELQIIMHDSLGSDLTDIHVALESNLNKNATEFNRSILENLYNRTLKVIQSFRNQLLFIEDLNVAFENPFTGINLTLLRRYTDAGREVDFNISDNILDSFEENSYRYFHKSLHSDLFYLFSELCTNDLKYGRGESIWSINLKSDLLIINQENLIRQDTEISIGENPSPKSAMTRVHKLGGNFAASYAENQANEIRYSVFIEIPIPKAP
jgi:hypothetical protein